MLRRVPVDTVAYDACWISTESPTSGLRCPKHWLGNHRNPSRRGDSIEAQACFVLLKRSLGVFGDRFGSWMLVVGLDLVLEHPVRNAVLVASVGKVRHAQEIAAD